MIDLDNLIKSKYVAPFMVIGITGSVAVGKSTFAHDLADKLSQQNIKTTVISTDDFLMSNDELHERGLFDQKGFPQTYNLDLLEKVITRFRAGGKSTHYSSYSPGTGDYSPKRETIY